MSAALLLLGVLDVDDARLLELQPEVVALARALAHPREHGDAAVLLGEVVDELLDDDGLAHARAAEEADLAAAQVGLDEVDDLDAGLEHLELGRLVLEGGGGAVDGVALLGLDRAQLVHGLADHVQHAAEGGRAHGHRDGPAGVRWPSCRAPCRRWASMLTQRTRFSPEVLLHLRDHVDASPRPRASSWMRRAL